MHLSPASIALRLSYLKRRRTARLLFPVTLIALAAAALAAPQAQTSYNLNQADETVALFPFSPPEARPLLRSNIAALEARRTARLLLPRIAPDNPNPYLMGWRIPDQEYWQTIPGPAKTIPDDWTRFPAMRYTNSQLGGVREVRLAVGQVYDQWLLSDPTHKLFACISVEKSTRRIYFMEIARSEIPADKGKWVYHAAFDNCYSCHPSGPRAIRPLDDQGVDRAILQSFNRRILAYHACDYGNTVSEAVRGNPVSDSACSGCHNGVNRGKLYGIHQKTIEFKKEMERTMPMG